MVHDYALVTVVPMRRKTPIRVNIKDTESGLVVWYTSLHVVTLCLTWHFRALFLRKEAIHYLLMCNTSSVSAISFKLLILILG